MKAYKFIYLICSLLIWAFNLKAQTVKSPIIIQKVKSKVQQFIKSDALYPKSYLPVKWSELSLIRTLKGSEFLEQTNDPSINIKLDSLILLEKESTYYPNYTQVYTIIHAFKLKTIGAGMMLRVYAYHLDINFNIIDVDRDSPEDQIEKSRKSIERADLEKKIINEISTMKIELLKKQ